MTAATLPPPLQRPADEVLPLGTNASHTVDLDAATYRYPGFTLGPITWSLPTGGRGALVGANGAGKTTLLGILAGQLLPSTGVAMIAGVNAAVDAMLVRERVAFVSERLLCCPWLTAREHFHLQSRFYPEWDAALALDTAARLSLDTRVPLQTLSRGNSLKAGIASALGQRARLLLLDEPTAGLDPVARRDFMRILSEQIESDSALTILFATHILEDLDDLGATSLLVLRSGKAIQSAPTANEAQSPSALARTFLLGDAS